MEREIAFQISEANRRTFKKRDRAAAVPFHFPASFDCQYPRKTLTNMVEDL